MLIHLKKRNDKIVKFNKKFSQVGLSPDPQSLKFSHSTFLFFFIKKSQSILITAFQGKKPTGPLFNI